MVMDLSIEELRARLEAYLSAATSARARITAVEQLVGGACQDNYGLEVEIDAGGGGLGGHALQGAVVLRTDRGQALGGSLTRAHEYRVMLAAYRAGVPTPEPLLLEEDARHIGHPFYLMRRIPGVAIGRRVVSDEALAGARAALPEALAQALARIHALTPNNPGLAVLPAPQPSPALAAVAWAAESLHGLPDPHPALELALRWLRANAPRTPQVTLVHGDFRTGNLMLTPDGLSGVLDWEFARLGDPLEDLAWLCLRDWRFGNDHLPVGGFAEREPFYQAYAAASGCAVDHERARYWEVMGNVRWAIGAAQQPLRHLAGRDRSIELASIGRRVAEMELEALVLITHRRDAETQRRQKMEDGG
jgi:aminoglycoside phosphotransferase (APT) family kinase protein